MSTTVFFVDDDHRCLDSIRRTLSDIDICKDWEILFFTSAAKALETASRKRVSALVTDEHMPEMSGHELITAIRSTSPQLVAILFTGDAGDALESDIVRIEKPCDAEHLAKVIDDLLKTVPRERPNE